jgi:hypothetical protein
MGICGYSLTEYRWQKSEEKKNEQPSPLIMAMLKSVD